MVKFAQGIYEVQNPQKYVGKGKPKYRSGWELTMMRFCDNHDKVLQWASESIQIPYRNPLTGKVTVYVPDFLIMYQGPNGQKITEIVEIKPAKQTTLQEAGRSKKDQLAAILNQAKWSAAVAYCKRIGVNFRVITEREIFAQGKK